MALIIRTFMDTYAYAMKEWSDPRVENFFLMSGPFPILSIVGLYLYFVLNWGPSYMKNRNSFNIDKILIIYNIIQVLVCIYVVQLFVKEVLFTYNVVCEPIDWSTSDHALLVVRHVWLYFIIKVIDLLDTVFFVLRKKQNQVTFLHVYHHAGMVTLTWLATKFVPGGSGVYLGVINCFVHAVMYGYYLLTVWDKKYKKSVWWKKHITQLQLIQFGILFLLFAELLFQDCGYPKWVSLGLLPQNIFMFILFFDFYIKTYIRKSKVVEQVNNVPTSDESPTKVD